MLRKSALAGLRGVIPHYGLRTLLIAVTIASALAAWGGAIIRRARIERQCAERIEQLSGEVSWSLAPDAGLFNWLSGHNLAAHVTGVGLFEGCDTSVIEAIEPLGSLKSIRFGRFAACEQCLTLPSLRNIEYLSAESLTDRSMTTLCGLSRLRHISIANSTVSDRGIMQLSALRSLEELSAEHAAITGEGFSAFRAHRSLKRLSLSQSNIDDKGALAISRLPSIESVNVAHTRITEEGLVTLLGCRSIKYLDVGENKIEWNRLEQDLAEHFESAARSCRVSDLELARTGLANCNLDSVSRLRSVRTLSLRKNAIGDGSLEPVIQELRLSNLDLSDTQLNHQGLVALSKSGTIRLLDLSNCHVSVNDLRLLHAMPVLQVLALFGVGENDQQLMQLRQSWPRRIRFHW